MTVLHLVRHGQSVWNAERRLLGQADPVPLTPLGAEQARGAARQLAGRDVVAIHSSDLLRARVTAEVVASALGLPVQVDPGLREQGFGPLEGRLTADVLARAPYDFTDPDARVEGGESTRDVHERIGARLAHYVRRYRGRECVLVSHGDAIRVALAWLAGLGPHEVPWREVPNGSVTSVAVSDSSARPPVR